MATHRTPSSQTVLRKNSRAGGSRFPDFSNQNSMVLAQNRHKDQWNRIMSPEISSYIWSQLIYNKRAKARNMQQGKDSLFNKWY